LKISFAGLVLGVAICAIGVLALVGSWGGHWFDREIQDRGGRSVGHVTDKHFSQPNDWDVDYWFLLPDGQRVDARRRGISEALWQRLQIGDLIDVRYELNNPARNFPAKEGNTPAVPVIIASVIGLAFTIAGVSLVIGSVRARDPRGRER
jgi:hypothetical protein